MDSNYSYSIHPSGYVSIKNLIGETIAVIDFEEQLNFTKSISIEIKEEIKTFLKNNDIPFF